MCFYRPLGKAHAPEALCQWGLLTRWPCLWLFKALPEVLARSHLTCSILLTPCSCTAAHVLVSAGIRPVTKLSPFSASYKISNYTGQVDSLTDSEGHGDRSLMYLATYGHPVGSTLCPPFLPAHPPNWLCQQCGHPVLGSSPGSLCHIVPFPFLAASLQTEDMPGMPVLATPPPIHTTTEFSPFPYTLLLHASMPWKPPGQEPTSGHKMGTSRSLSQGFG